MPQDIITLKVLSARAVHVAVNALAADFSRDTGCKTGIAFAPVGALQDRLAAGERADVLILSVAGIERLEKSAGLVAGSRAVLGQTSIGVAMREGAAAPDIASPEAFKRTLLAARAVALSDAAVGGSAGIYLRDLFERMGIAETIRAKALPQKSGAAVAKSVAKGEAGIGMTFISEMLPVKGICVIGPLPAPLGNATAYAAAIMAGSRHPKEARAFIAALLQANRRDVWKAAGFELPGGA